MKIKETKKNIVLENWYKGKWICHYYPRNLNTEERVYNEYYSFYQRKDVEANK